MFAVSSRFLAALRTSHTMISRVDAYAGSRLLAGDLPIAEGSVSVSAGTGVHRKLSLTVADRALWPVLSAVGVELRAWRGIRYTDGTQEMVPLGVFGLDTQSLPVITGGGVSISGAPDRWARVQRARFEAPRVSNYPIAVVDQIATLVREALRVRVDTGGVTGVNLAAVAQTPVLVWDRDRDKAIQDLATTAGVEVFFGPTGDLVIRDAVARTRAPVWQVHAGRDGVMISGTATRDRSRVYNVVVVVSAKTDGQPPFFPVAVEDTDPQSPTNVGGPFGRTPYFLTSATLGNAEDARAAGAALLAKTKVRYTDMSVSAVVNPALESGDTISVTAEDGSRQVFVADSFDVPLTADNEQNLTLRTRAAVTGDSSETDAT